MEVLQAADSSPLQALHQQETTVWQGREYGGAHTEGIQIFLAATH